MLISVNFSIDFTRKKCAYFILYQTKILKRTVVDRTLSFLHGGPLEIRLTVPLNHV